MATNASDKIAAKLNKLTDLRSQIEKTSAEYELAKLNAVKPVRGKLDAIEGKYSGSLERETAKAQLLEAEIRSDVLAFQESVKADKLHAIYVKGRVTWDGKGLDGYSVANPQVLTFRKQGEPSVTIRSVA